MAPAYYSGNDCTNSSTTSSSSTAWVNWNVCYHNGTSIELTTTATNVWTVWNGTVTNATSDTSHIWVRWNQSGTVAAIQPPIRQVSEEQLAAWERQRQESAERERQEREKREAAEQRAEELLQLLLDEQQRGEYREKKQFHLYTKSGKKYRIERGRSGNVKLIDQTEKVEASFCIHHKEVLPTGDLMLHQKLLLETDEEQFLKTAKKTEMRPRAA